MSKPYALVDQLKELLHRKKSKQYYAEILDVSVAKVEQLLSQIKGLSPLTSTVENFKEGKSEISARFDSEIRTLEELIERCRIDLSIWNIDKYVQNYWGNSNDPHWQVKVFLSKKQPNTEEALIKALGNYKSSYKPLKKEDILLSNGKKSVSVLISLADPHIDKQTIDKTTIEKKMKTYLHILQNLLIQSLQSYKLEEVVLVLGNDYFTSDCYHASTTNLTPQHTTDDFDVAYEKGFELGIEAINLCSNFSKRVKVIFVPANHDRTKSFYLVHALEIYFSKNHNIVFDRSAENAKVHMYGQNFIGFHHGDTKIEDLPTYFASKFKEEWGCCKYAEIALADKHHKRQWKQVDSEREINGTRMFIAPSLTTPDKWHKGKRFDLAIQAGVARFYHKEKGYCGETEDRLN